MTENGNRLASHPGFDAPSASLVLRLYVARGATNSVRALANLKAILNEHFVDGYTLEVVDVLQDPKRAIADAILVTPTLVKLSPPPLTQIAGNLSQTEKVVAALGGAAGS